MNQSQNLNLNSQRTLLVNKSSCLTQKSPSFNQFLEVDESAQELQVQVPNSSNPEETAELTYYGAEVIHPFTMDLVIRASIPIRIKNTFNPSGHGSVIIPSGYVSPMGSLTAAADDKIQSKRPIAAYARYPPSLLPASRVVHSFYGLPL